MYTATMEYEFKEDRFDEASLLWRDEVLYLAKKQAGFVRMQFLVSSPKAMAIGTWKSDEDAKNFMQTGVFKDLMEKLKDMISSEPKPQIWDLLYFAEK